MERSDQAAPAVRVDLLGALRLVVDGTEVTVPGMRRRGVLAMLALHRGNSVPVSRLLDAVWPDRAVERAALQMQIHRLRKAFGTSETCLITVADGYRLDVPTDLDQVDEYLRAARGSDGTSSDRVELLWRAQRRFRGPILADLVELPELAIEVAGLRRLEDEVRDALIEAAVAAGRGTEVLGLAADSVARQPGREAGVRALMRAQAASGAVAAALRTAHDHRRHVVSTTGIEPSPAFIELERSIATSEPTTDTPSLGAPALRVRTDGEPAPTPAKSADRARRLFGRDAELDRLNALLVSDRLVTVVGAGGVGKTALAHAIAADRGATVLWLAGVRDPESLPQAMAATLGVSVQRGDPTAACAAALEGEPRMLVIDNAEHLANGVRHLTSRLLEACPELRIVITSRVPIGLASEQVLRLGPLAVPPDDTTTETTAAVELFVERARGARGGRELDAADRDVGTRIVRRLEGLPLAIELAARRLSVFDAADLLMRLDRALDLLGQPAPAEDDRHGTLRATIAWSADLLDERTRRFFRHLSVFPDGTDLRTAEFVGHTLPIGRDPAAALADLVDASVIDRHGGVTPRYRMLETIRMFGLDELDEHGESAAAHGLLVDWAVEWSGRIGRALSGVDEPAADRELRRELPNLRAAMAAARRQDRRADAALVVIALSDAVAYRDVTELRTWALDLVRVAPEPDPALIGVAAEAAYHNGVLDRAEELSAAALAIGGPSDSKATAALVAAQVALARGDVDRVLELADAHGGGPRGAEVGGVAALAVLYAGDLERARQLNARAYAGANSPTLLAWRHFIDGEIANLGGQHLAAERHYTSSIDLAREAGSTFVVGVATVGLLTARGDTDPAWSLATFRSVIEQFVSTRNWTHLWVTLDNLASKLRSLGDTATADRIEAASAYTQAEGAVGSAEGAVGSAPPPTKLAGASPGSHDVRLIVDASFDAIDRQLADQRADLAGAVTTDP